MVAWSLTLIHVYTMFDPLTYTWAVDHTLLGLTNPRELRINDLKTSPTLFSLCNISSLNMH